MIQLGYTRVLFFLPEHRRAHEKLNIPKMSNFSGRNQDRLRTFFLFGTARRRRRRQQMESKIKKKRSDASQQRYENIYNLSEGLKEVVAEGGGGGGGSSETVTEWHEWKDADTSDSDDSDKGWSSFSSGEGKEGGDGEGEAALRGSRDLTRKTVDAVRVLEEMGRINEGEKSLLLADVIR